MNKKLTIRLTIVGALVVGALLALKACSRTAPTPPEEEQRLLVVDGLTITLAELAPFVDYIRSFRPEGGEKATTMKVLLDHVLPMRLAQRAFPEERERMRELAQGLSDVADTVYDLEKFTENSGDKQRKTLARMQARLPVSMFVFDQLHVGMVSEPLELPQGWFVVSCYEMVPSDVVVGDLCDVLQVAFVTHSAEQWELWYNEEKQRIRDRVTFVHPRYRDDLPPWLDPPKKP